MKVSVIIPSYNRATILALTLNSLAEQKDLPPDSMEVIVCDDGSSDRTRDLVESFQGRLNIHYLFQEDCGYRVARARNMGLKRAKNEIVVLLDAGVAVASQCISQHLRMHTSPASKAVVLGYIYGYNYTLRSRDLDADFDFMRPDKTITALQKSGQHLDIREQNYRAVEDKLERLPAPWTLFWTTNVSFSVAFARDIDYFNERFEGWGVEDIELAYRFFKAGGKFSLNRQAAGLHYPHERNREQQKASNVKNRQLFLQLHPDDIVKKYMRATALGFNLELLESAAV